MNVEVIKFGGTSLKTKKIREKVVKIIQSLIKQNNKVIVVVSAIGRYPDYYATDSLRRLAPNASLQEMDLLMSVGETISTVVLSSELKNKNIKSIAINTYELGFATNSEFNNANIIKVNKEYLNKYLDLYDVLVVPGFQGIDEEGKVTTLGRGGSDFSAVVLAHQFGAKRVKIYSDVQGLMTANPKEVKDARLIRTIGYDEVINMSYQGAKVVHYKAVEYAKEHNIEIELRSALNNDPGTVVKHINYKKKKIIGLGSIENLLYLVINFKDNLHLKQDEFFKILSKFNIEIDFLVFSPKEIKFVINDIDSEILNKTFEKKEIKVSLVKECAKIALVNNNPNYNSNFIIKAISYLLKNDINILNVSNSYTTVWLLVEKKDLAKSLNLIHDYFKLGG